MSHRFHAANPDLIRFGVHFAAKAVAFHEALQPEFREYAQAVVDNAKLLAEELQKRGCVLVTGGTDNHLILIDVYKSFGIDGKEAQERLENINSTANANAIPDDTWPPFRPSGLRLGTPAVTTRGAVTNFHELADKICSALS